MYFHHKALFTRVTKPKYKVGQELFFTAKSHDSLISFADFNGRKCKIISICKYNDGSWQYYIRLDKCHAYVDEYELTADLEINKESTTLTKINHVPLKNISNPIKKSVKNSVQPKFKIKQQVHYCIDNVDTYKVEHIDDKFVTVSNNRTGVCLTDNIIYFIPVESYEKISTTTCKTEDPGIDVFKNLVMQLANSDPGELSGNYVVKLCKQALQK